MCSRSPLGSRQIPLLDRKAMSTFSRTDRTIVHRTTLGQQGRDAGVPAATPVERIMMVWPLTLTAWAFKEPNVAQPRLQRIYTIIKRQPS